MKISILVPTYNESKNIGNLLAGLKDAANQSTGAEFDVIVLDDSSPDGTADLARQIGATLCGSDGASTNYRVHVWIRAQKEGLGKAYIWGFKKLLNQTEVPDYILQMDADLSHDPKYIKNFVESAGKGADFVTATRYVDGGGTPDWPWYRKLLSRGGNFYARSILGRQITDYTGGFNMYKTTLLKKIDFDGLFSAGYGFLIDLKFQSSKAALKIAEVPIVFHDRQHGYSKMPARTIFDSCLLVLKIKVRNLLQKN
ncbi:polyprenol monophosphomannose synthase [Paraburkholderia bannensis]|uniref:polyprenol monophosphomannose synthase n=1 Tax=Paraburkholderia bannensis TaxID=765414 RepID=UPI002AC35EB5|nr:polyprenol monophosphomannose synthase [Paraburkholderia bannensis]